MSQHDVTYFKMLDTILLNESTVLQNRTATTTINTIGYMAKYPVDAHVRPNGDMQLDHFPLLTTKKLSFKNIVTELIWFLNGQTNIEYLEQRNVHIWADWPLKAYNKKAEENGHDPITREEFIKRIQTDRLFASLNGELGPVYGSQWRDWQAGGYDEHGTFGETDPRSIDQIEALLNTLHTSPTSRRNIVTAWNPAELEEMAVSGLPPCHSLWQVLTKPSDNAIHLNLQMYQRSLDSFLGAPYNIASYTLLMGLIGEWAAMLPDTFTHFIADCHLYTNHLDQIKEQMTREPYAAPYVVIQEGTLRSLMKIPVGTKDFDLLDQIVDSISLHDYKHHPYLAGDVAI